MSSEHINLYILVAITAFIVLTLGRVLRLYRMGKNNPSTQGKAKDMIKEINISHPIISKLYDHYSQTMIGQNHVFIGLMGCWLAGGHCLLTGLPGTGKTQAVKTWIQLMGLDMGRVQGTSDLLPADITGSLIYNPKTNEFDTVFGPIMHECVLVDEINRMPSKTQSALLQAMAEGHIVVGQETYDLPQRFTVFATQNPHDRVGTFPLPQAQLDRFMCQVTVTPVNIEQQGKILNQTNSKFKIQNSKFIVEDMQQIMREYESIVVPESITSSVAQLLQDQGLSSRAGQHIISFARALALMGNKGQVDQSDLTTALNYTVEHRLR